MSHSDENKPKKKCSFSVCVCVCGLSCHDEIKTCFTTDDSAVITFIILSCFFSDSFWGNFKTCNLKFYLLIHIAAGTYSCLVICTNRRNHTHF